MENSHHYIELCGERFTRDLNRRQVVLPSAMRATLATDGLSLVEEETQMKSTDCDVCRQDRSAVPDLLFEDIQAARVADLRPYLEHPEAVDERTQLYNH